MKIQFVSVIILHTLIDFDICQLSCVMDLHCVLPQVEVAQLHRTSEANVLRSVEFAASRTLAEKLGSKVRAEPRVTPTTRMERTLMWNPHRVLQRRLRVETDWHFIL